MAISRSVRLLHSILTPSFFLYADTLSNITGKGSLAVAILPRVKYFSRVLTVKPVLSDTTYPLPASRLSYELPTCLHSIPLERATRTEEKSLILETGLQVLYTFLYIVTIAVGSALPAIGNNSQYSQ